MHSVAIVGAGELGGTIAHALARRDGVGAITLVDETGRVAAGKALDIAQAAPVEGSPRDVALTVLGVPPDHIVIPWEDATVGGFGLTRLVDEPARRRLRAKVPALWPPRPHALAAAAVKAIESMAGRQRQMVSCFVAPDTSAGVSSRTAALPVRLGPARVVDVVMPELSVVERVALDNAMEV